MVVSLDLKATEALALVEIKKTEHGGRRADVTSQKLRER
jgi:hypothetical protein